MFFLAFFKNHFWLLESSCHQQQGPGAMGTRAIIYTQNHKGANLPLVLLLPQSSWTYLVRGSWVFQEKEFNWLVCLLRCVTKWMTCLGKMAHETFLSCALSWQALCTSPRLEMASLNRLRMSFQKAKRYKYEWHLSMLILARWACLWSPLMRE